VVWGGDLQTTVSKPITFEGIGLHKGLKSKLLVLPAEPDFGICFKRTDVQSGDAYIPAILNNVVNSELCTRLENSDDISVSTVEHLMAALAGCGINNALLEIDGPEVPILDGSSLIFVKEILKSGIKLQNRSLKAVRILKSVEYKRDLAWAKFEPSANPKMSFSIEFSEEAIGAQSKTLDMSNGSFVRELCDSRTFCRHSEVEAMRSKGLALGGSYENAVVVDGKNVLSPGGLRHSDEPVRHKMLDALGDIALAGFPIIGHYVGHKAGHGITHGLLRNLFYDKENFEIISCDKEAIENLPGTGVKLSEVCKVA
jgi:UDP-3-O-[3-hydroxymyristoyl] N-acetylglucosamine deacetylase